jgi:hypothetical protein
MLYPARPDPPLSVEVAHVREMVVAVVVETEILPGIVGAVESTVTVVAAVLVPFAFVAVRVYVIVDVGFTVVDAMSVLVLKEPGVMATELAFVMFQESVLVPAEATIDEEAVKEKMSGREGPVAALKVATAIPPTLAVPPRVILALIEDCVEEATAYSALELPFPFDVVAVTLLGIVPEAAPTLPAVQGVGLLKSLAPATITSLAWVVEKLPEVSVAAEPLPVLVASRGLFVSSPENCITDIAAGFATLKFAVICRMAEPIIFLA